MKARSCQSETRLPATMQGVAWVFESWSLYQFQHDKREVHHVIVKAFDTASHFVTYM